MAISIVKPTPGSDAGVWGTELNTALDVIVSGVNGSVQTVNGTAPDSGGNVVVSGSGTTIDDTTTSPSSVWSSTMTAAADAQAVIDATTAAAAATRSADTLTDGTTKKAFLATERTKLSTAVLKVNGSSPDSSGNVTVTFTTVPISWRPVDITYNSPAVTAGTSIIIAKPGHMADGDTLLAVIYCSIAAATITPPAGWTAQTHAVNASARTCYVFVKSIPSAAAESATSYTFTSSSSGRCLGTIIPMVGAATTPLDAAPTSDTGTASATIVDPALTAVSASAMLLSVNYMQGVTSTTYTETATGFTALARTTVDNAGSTSTLDVQYKQLTASGTTGTQTFTLSGSPSSGGGFLISFVPAVAAGGSIGGGGGGTATMTTASWQAALGVVPLDSFTGADDDAKMTAALSYIGAQTYAPCLVLANRSHTFGTMYNPFSINGFAMSGPLGAGIAREFRETCRVQCPTGGLFAWTTTGRDFSFKGLSFELTDYFIQPAATDDSAGHISDISFDGCSWQGGLTVLAGSFLRLSLERFYINGVTSTALKLGGSDSSIACGGVCYLSGSIAATLPFMDIGMSQTKIGHVYVTAQTGFAVRVNFSYGGLVFDNTMGDDYGRSGGAVTQNAGLQITGGNGVEFRSWWSNNVNASGTSKGDIVVTGGTGHVFTSPAFAKNYASWANVNNNGPAIYTTVPIRVISPKSINAYPKVLQQATAGKIVCDDSSWTINTAP